MITQLKLPIPPPPPPPPPPDKITVTTSFDYRGKAFLGIDHIEFAGFDFSRASFSSTQFGPGLISDSVAITGDNFRNFVDVHLSNGDTNFSAAGWSFSNFVPFNPSQNDEVNIFGSAASDTITGSIMADGLIGNDGDDVLSGLDGRDQLIGGNGTDTLIGGNGDDIYRLEDVHQSGPLASDLAYDTVIEGADGGIDIVGIHNISTLQRYDLPENVENGSIVGAGTFVLAGNALINKLDGNNDANTLIGRQGADTLNGLGGDDTLGGGRGGDLIDGGLGNDQVSGGRGTDSIGGNAGNDTLTGDLGPDTFFFASGSGTDIITDFKDTGGAADDLIDVSRYNFADVDDIGRSAKGNDLVLDFGSGNTLVIVDYLENHSASAIRDDMLIFV